MTRVGIRELKSKLSYYLAQVKEGEPVEVTERGVPIAVIMPPARTEQDVMQDLVRRGIVSWSGGKPQGAHPRVALKGKPLSEYILEGRE